MSLAITAGSLPTLRPLYRVAAQKFSWKTSFFSNRSRSYESMNPPSSKFTQTIGSAVISRKESGFTSCSESVRKIVNVESEEFVLEDQRPLTGGKFMGITQTTHVRIDYEDDSKV